MFKVSFDFGDLFRKGLQETFKRRHRKANRESLRVARSTLATLRHIVSTPYPPASVPGEPPRKRSGVGRLAISLHKETSWGGLNTWYIYVKPQGWYMEGWDQGDFGMDRRRPWMTGPLALVHLENGIATVRDTVIGR